MFLVGQVTGDSVSPAKAGSDLISQAVRGLTPAAHTNFALRAVDLRSGSPIRGRRSG
jgi:hypothetical protein